MIRAGAMLLLVLMAWGLALTLLAGCESSDSTPTGSRALTCIDRPVGSPVASGCE